MTRCESVVCSLCRLRLWARDVDAHRRWHVQNSLHGVDCPVATQTNPADQPTVCECGISA